MAVLKASAERPGSYSGKRRETANRIDVPTRRIGRVLRYFENLLPTKLEFGKRLKLMLIRSKLEWDCLGREAADLDISQGSSSPL